MIPYLILAFIVFFAYQKTTQFVKEVRNKTWNKWGAILYGIDVFTILFVTYACIKYILQ